MEFEEGYSEEPEEVSALNESTTLHKIAESTKAIEQELAKVVVGNQQVIRLMLAGVYTGGHVLLEGVPGIAKTLLARMLAKTLSAGFSRIQFTPDLMPTDVTGTTILNMKTSELSFNKGPIFSNIILIDEINRAPAKTQASLFEVMAEKQITYDGTTYKMEEPFFVMATQNPIEQEGTYKLPEAQLDRFIFKLEMEYPSLEEELAILSRFRKDFSQKAIKEVQPVLSKEDLATVRNEVESVYIKDELIQYIAQITFATRNHPDLFLGASPRASLAMLQTSKALAAMAGRNYVTPDDVRNVTYAVLNHRVILTPEKEMEGTTLQEVVNNIVSQVEVPR